MLDINYIRENIDIVEKKVLSKGVNFDKNHFNKLDKERRSQITEMERFKSEKNKIAKEIGLRARNKENIEDLKEQSIKLSEDIDRIKSSLEKLEKEFNNIILEIPNIIHESVPVGKDEKDNIVIRTWGKKPEFNFKPLPHWELGEKNNFLDIKRATKIAGARFSISTGTLAKLERELINLMLETHTNENGYTEVLPPFLVNDTSLIGTGNLPKFKEDLYKVENNNLYLVPTAEVPLTNIHRDEFLKESELPVKYVAYTPCFRSEAGSHGKDIRGIIRQHQFNKVELLKFCKPENSHKELEALTNNAEQILQKLKIHYRVVLLCSGDTSFSSAKTYDIEVWMPERNNYVEISSCSNFESFQARRARIKYKTENNKKFFVHTLNGSGLALGRTVAAIMENYQTEEGKIKIPDILVDKFNDIEYL
jgi:seryl-tRNA synthetase